MGCGGRLPINRRRVNTPILRIYSTNDTARANALCRLLENAGITAHVTGAHVAELNIPGLSAVHDLVNVWLLDAGQLNEVRTLMIEAGFAEVDGSAPLKPVIDRLPDWLIVLVFATGAVVLGLLSF